MTGYRYAKWRNCRKYTVSVAALLAVSCILALVTTVRVRSDDVPVPPVPRELYDHPLLFLCIMILLALLCVVLILSRLKLQHSERRYRAIFEDNGAVMLLIDPVSLQVLNANPAACAFYGWSPAEFSEKRITEISILPEEQVRELYHDIVHFERRRFRSCHRLASGEERDVEVNSIPYRVDGRECLFSIIHTIAESRNESGRPS